MRRLLLAALVMAAPATALADKFDDLACAGEITVSKDERARACLRIIGDQTAAGDVRALRTRVVELEDRLGRLEAVVREKVGTATPAELTADLPKPKPQYKTLPGGVLVPVAP